MNLFLARRFDGKREWFRYRTSTSNGVTYYYVYLGPYTLTFWRPHDQVHNPR